MVNCLAALFPNVEPCRNNIGPLHVSIHKSTFHNSQWSYPPQRNSNMNEDERYRTSTQYRLWSYTPEALASLRATTNQVAAERVKAAIQRARASRATSTSASAETSEAEQNGSTSRAVSLDLGTDINCLTVEEELKLLNYYCKKALELGDHLKVPTDVKVRHLAPHMANKLTF